MADYYDTTIIPTRVRKPKDYIQKILSPII